MLSKICLSHKEIRTKSLFKKFLNYKLYSNKEINYIKKCKSLKDLSVKKILT